MRNDPREQPLIISQPAHVLYAAEGPVYLGVHHSGRGSQPVRRETRRIIRREIQAPDGRAGLELTEEHTFHYADPRKDQEPDVVRTMLAGVVSFIGMCLVFSGLGGSSQSFASLPFYLVVFFLCWWLLA